MSRIAIPAGIGSAPAAAEINGRSYCLSAHAYLDKHLAKLEDAELAANRSGTSNVPKAAAAVRFAAKEGRARGRVGDGDVQAVRMACCSEGRIVGIVQHVAFDPSTSDIDEVAGTGVDFPVAAAYRTA